MYNIKRKNAHAKIIKVLYLRELTFTEIVKETKLSKPTITECLKELESLNIIIKSDKEIKYVNGRKYKLSNNDINNEYLKEKLLSFSLYVDFIEGLSKTMILCQSSNAQEMNNKFKEILIPELVKRIGELVLIGYCLKNNNKTLIHDTLNYIQLEMDSWYNFKQSTKEYTINKYNINDFNDIEKELDNIDLETVLENFRKVLYSDSICYETLHYHNVTTKKEILDKLKTKYEKLGYPFINLFNYDIYRIKKYLENKN